MEPTSQYSFVELITMVGVAAIASGLIYIGRKLQILDHLNETVGKIKSNLKVIGDFLVRSDMPFDGDKLQSYSPTQLTDPGKKYLQEIGFDTLFNEHAADFYTYIDNEKPGSNYDIENAAIRSVMQLFDYPYFGPVKEYFYNNPNEDRKAFLRIAGVYVRDKYMNFKRTQ